MQPLKIGKDEWFHPTFYWPSDYVSMLWLKVFHVSKIGHRRLNNNNPSSIQAMASMFEFPTVAILELQTWQYHHVCACSDTVLVMVG